MDQSNNPRSLLAIPVSIAGQDVSLSDSVEIIKMEAIQKQKNKLGIRQIRSDMSSGNHQPLSWKEILNQAFENQINDINPQYKCFNPTKYKSGFILDESLQHQAGRSFLIKILTELEEITWKGWGNPFNVEITPKVMPPDYFLIVKKPICLIDMRRKYEQDETYNLRQFDRDITLMIKNAMKFNREGEPVYGMALDIRARFEALRNESVALPATEVSKKRGRSPVP